ncbi:MAG: aspartate/glutamate racemase family protein [Bacteroidales bacterium]
MKTIGLIGGLSWESTVDYYRIINREVNQRLGGAHSAPMLMYSFNFEEIVKFNSQNDFDGIGRRLIEESVKIEKAGADLLLLCANSAHRWANEVQHAISIPIIHIADATGKEINRLGLKKVLLLGTRYTMEGDFVIPKLKDKFGIEAVVPDSTDRDFIHHIIFDELVVGDFKESTKSRLSEIIKKERDVEGVILGCTELPLIITQTDSTLPFINTTEIHAKAAVDFAIN